MEKRVQERSRQKGMKDKKILVVDDEEILRMLITETLEFEGYQIVEAEDGRVGYEKMIDENFDLIILDYMMPHMTGMDVLEKVYSLELNIPIIMLTAKSQQADRDLAHQYGASHFMAKPFSPAELVRLVQSILQP